MCGPPASRAIWQTTAAMLPPALHPQTASWPGTPPSASALAAIQRTAANPSRPPRGIALRARDDSRRRRRWRWTARTGRDRTDRRSRGRRIPSRRRESRRRSDAGPGSPAGRGDTGARRPRRAARRRRPRRPRGRAADRAHRDNEGARIGDRQRLERRKPELPDQVEQHPDVELQAADDAVVAAPAGGPLNVKPR